MPCKYFLLKLNNEINDYFRSLTNSSCNYLSLSLLIKFPTSLYIFSHSCNPCPINGNIKCGIKLANSHSSAHIYVCMMLIRLTWLRTEYCARFWRKLISTLIARFMGSTWGSPGADRTQVGPMLAPWTLFSGQWLVIFSFWINLYYPSYLYHIFCWHKYQACIFYKDTAVFAHIT